VHSDCWRHSRHIELRLPLQPYDVLADRKKRMELLRLEVRLVHGGGANPRGGALPRAPA